MLNHKLVSLPRWEGASVEIELVLGSYIIVLRYYTCVLTLKAKEINQMNSTESINLLAVHWNFILNRKYWKIKAQYVDKKKTHNTKVIPETTLLFNLLCCIKVDHMLSRAIVLSFSDLYVPNLLSLQCNRDLEPISFRQQMIIIRKFI